MCRYLHYLWKGEGLLCALQKFNLVVALDFCNKNVTFVMCISITSWDTWREVGGGAGYGWIAEI